MEYKFQILVPGGNDTALVYGMTEGLEESYRKAIDVQIRDKYKNVEQVGFVGLANMDNPWLTMAGGEFCGNATRAAAWYYLGGRPGSIEIAVSGVPYRLRAGVNGSLEAWSQIPVKNKKEIDSGTYLVELEGISHIVMSQEKSKQYLSILSKNPPEDGESKLKTLAKNILKQHDLLKQPAAGVMFLEDVNDSLKMHPIVHVVNTQTLYYETACGSGTAAVGVVMCKHDSGRERISILQPTSKTINVTVERQNASSYVEITGIIDVDDNSYSDVLSGRGLV